MSKPLVIAVDGPAGVGKSTLAIALAREYDLTYVETGALYRSVALAAMRQGVALDDEAGLADIAATLAIAFEMTEEVNRVLLGGEEITLALRSPEMGQAASKVSALPAVRAALLELQRGFAVQGAVAEGRDIGTVVFPEADVKFFLVADVEERARRRYEQLKEMGKEVDKAELEAEIAARDEQDSGRAVAPLQAADDSITIDTTHLDIEGVLEVMRAHIAAVADEPEDYRSGFVAIVGRPNVGKSTLMNTVLGTKVAIVTPRPQTTRHKITGIATYADCQVVFLDTPGIHLPRGNLNRVMVDVAYSSLEEADAVCFMVDASAESKRSGIHPANQAILERLEQEGKPVVLVLNKVDLVRKQALLPLIGRYSQRHPFVAIVPTAAIKGDGIEGFLKEIRALMPEGGRFYPDGMLTDRSRDFIITEFIREQVFLRTRQELPYSVAVTIDQVEDREPEPEQKKPPLLHIIASIHVERASQKGMIIGKHGSMVKEVGQSARLALEKYLGRRVYLELHVRVEKDWTRSDKGMHKVGFET